MGPLISVITPNLNQGIFLEQTIQSVLNQGYPHIEYIILDGGSTDSSIDIIRRYESRLDYWVSEPDGGQAAAIKAGFAMAKGDILCWLNADDLFLSGACAAVAQHFDRNPSTHALSAGAYLIDRNGDLLNGWPPALSLGSPATFDQLRFLGMGSMVQAATFWRRSAYDAVGGIDTTLEIVMDVDLFLRFAKLHPFENLRRLVACFRYYDQSKGQIMRSRHPIELAKLAERYGMSNYGKTSLRLKYLRWRIPQVVERFWLAALFSMGRLRLPNPP